MEKTNNNDHDLLIRIDEQLRLLTIEVKGLKANFSDRISGVEQTKMSTKEAERIHEDHEARLRKLEFWGAIAIGVLGVLQVVGFDNILKIFQ